MTTSSKYCGTASTDASNGGDDDWTGGAVSNAQGAPDGTSVTCGLVGGSAGSWYLVLKNFGFAIPSTATILGITVVVRKRVNSGSNTFDTHARIIKGGTIGSTDESKGTAWPTSLTDVSYGGSSDLWGETWNYSHINSSDFGFAIAAVQTSGSRTLSVDSVQITVTYNDGEAEEVFIAMGRVMMQQP